MNPFDFSRLVTSLKIFGSSFRERQHYILEISYWHPWQSHFKSSGNYVLYSYYVQNFKFEWGLGRTMTSLSPLLLSMFSDLVFLVFPFYKERSSFSDPKGCILLSTACKCLFISMLLITVFYLKAQLIV